MTKTALMFQILQGQSKPITVANIVWIMKDEGVNVTGETIAGYLGKLYHKKVITIYNHCGVRGGMGYKLNRRSSLTKLLLGKYSSEWY